MDSVGFHQRKRIVYVVNPAVFFLSHRLALAKRAQADGYDVSVVTPEGPGVNEIRKAGFDWYPMSFDPGGMNPARDLKTIRDLVRLFRCIRPDIVHNVTVKPVLYGTVAARLTGVARVVNAISGLGYLFTGNRPLRRLAGITLYRLLVRHPDMRVILQNEEDMALFRQLHLVPEKALCLIRGSGVDIAAFAPAPRSDGPPIILQVSRVVGDKGVREFIAAAKIVRHSYPSAQFVLVGPLYPDNPSALPEMEVRAAEAAGWIKWLGPREDIAALLKEATVFCLPSYREGLPKSLLEAGAAGLPCVTTDTSGCREVVRDGVNGLLVPVADPVALADAIIRLLADPAAAMEMGARAREITASEFALGPVLDAQIRLYREPALAC